MGVTSDNKMKTQILLTLLATGAAVVLGAPRVPDSHPKGPMEVLDMFAPEYSSPREGRLMINLNPEYEDAKMDMISDSIEKRSAYEPQEMPVVQEAMEFLARYQEEQDLERAERVEEEGPMTVDY